MKKNLTKIVKAVLCSFVLITSGCVSDSQLTEQDVKMSEAKSWFNQYEANGTNYELFQNMQYDWSQATITKSEDGTQTIIVPVIELKKEAQEIWEQKLYIYKLGNDSYDASLVEIYPDTKAQPETHSIEGTNFKGIISIWDLKKGFVKSARFNENHAVEEGIVEFVPSGKSMTSKAPPTSPCSVDGGCDDGGGGGDPPLNGGPLREVIIPPNPKSPPVVIYIPSAPIGGGGGTTPGGYIPHGGGGGGATPTPAPTQTPTPIANPCDKMKTLMANPNFIVKQDELLKKTNLKIETGYSQSKNGPFTPLVVSPSTASADKLNLNTTPDMIGYIHSHLDDYETGQVNKEGDLLTRKPIRMFSPADIGVFLDLVKNAQANNIPIDSVYGAMISSDGNYQLRFTGDPTQINTNFDWDSNTLREEYKTYFAKGSKEINFLNFLNDKSYIKGIELYKVNKNQTNTKKTLDSNNKIVNINC